LDRSEWLICTRQHVDANARGAANIKLWAITWRAQLAAWMVRHRSLLENALT
jgi:hypothetical protein